MSSIKQPSQAELTRLDAIAERLNDEWGSLSTGELLRRVFSRSAFIKNPTVVSSFGVDSSVLLHLLSEVSPSSQVIFLDTGFHFKETLNFQSTLSRNLRLKNIRIARVDPLAEKRFDGRGDLHQTRPDSCCQLRKVAVLDRHLRLFDTWVTGQRRAQASSRAGIRHVEVDEARGKLKINPLASWTDHDIETYKAAHTLPEHPLLAKGFPSVGCVPCTSQVRDGEGARAGRWRGTEKLECGLHNRPGLIASTGSAL